LFVLVLTKINQKKCTSMYKNVHQCTKIIHLFAFNQTKNRIQKCTLMYKNVHWCTKMYINS